MNEEIKQKIDSTLEKFSQDIRSLRLGRAHSDIVENLEIEAYDSKMRLSELASIQIPQIDQILIQAWDEKVVAAIEKAIISSDLNVTPAIEGTNIRIVLPPLTQERRMDLIKLLKKFGEEAKIAVRNIRENKMEDIEKSLKAKKISEDEKFKQRDTTQKIIDTANKTIDEQIKIKEAEITNQ